MESVVETNRQNKTTVTSAMILLAAVAASPASVGQENSDFSLSGSLEAGAEYSSNVSVSELETASDSGDTAATVDAGLDLSWQASSRLALNAGYNFSARRYQTVDDFDMDMHLLFADLSYDFDALTVGSSYFYADADLGGRSFLSQHQYSVYAGTLLTDTWYLRGALNFTDKRFPNFDARNADAEGVSIDSFWFFGQGRSNISAGYAFSDEKAQALEFSYRSHTFRLRHTHRFDFAGRESQFQAGIRLQERDYRGVTPGVGRRDDSQQVANASLDVAMSASLAIIGKIEIGNYDSNLDSANYRDNRISLSARFTFP
jgi:hypothetical protein